MIVEGYSIDLYCDVEGCPNGLHGVGHASFGGASKKKAWAMVYSCRWTKVGSKAFCPNHKPTKSTPPPVPGDLKP